MPITYGLTDDGFILKPLDVIKSEIEAKLRTDLGANINLLPESVFGQIIGLYAEREYLLWELADQLYGSQYPSMASDESLDLVCAITGITRRQATYSHVTLRFTGIAGTTIPAGTVVSVLGSPSTRFTTTETSVIPPTGEIDIEAECTITGPIPAYTGTLTELETPIVGVSSVTNPADAVLGSDIETDAELRARRNDQLQGIGNATLEAIRAQLLNVEDVTSVTGYENITFVVDIDGRPPKSYEFYVFGGDEDDIAQKLWESKPAGIATYGSISKTVVDSQGFNQIVKFSRPVEIDIYLEIDLTVSPDFPGDGLDQCKAALLAFGNALGTGQDVIVYPQLVASLNSIIGILDLVIRIGTSPGPTLDDNIIIAAFQKSAWDSSRITLAVV